MDQTLGFNVRSKIVGPGGVFVKHIQNETNARVQLKGKGSGFIEVSTGMEADEPMFVGIRYFSLEEFSGVWRTCFFFSSASHPDRVQRAKELVLDLLATVRQEYEQYKIALEQTSSYMQQQQYAGYYDYYAVREFFVGVCVVKGFVL